MTIDRSEDGTAILGGGLETEILFAGHLQHHRRET